jgi:hypothetical protein
MVHGLDKNIMSPGTQYKTFKLLLSPLAFFAPILAPFISILSWSLYTALPGLICLLISSALAVFMAIKKRDSLLHWLLTPIGFLIIAWIFSRACLVCWLRDGINWRGTHYPRKLLQQYQRVKF